MLIEVIFQAWPKNKEQISSSPGLWLRSPKPSVSKKPHGRLDRQISGVGPYNRVRDEFLHSWKEEGNKVESELRQEARGCLANLLYAGEEAQ